jgi:nucleotide sugar dehydrogenase
MICKSVEEVTARKSNIGVIGLGSIGYSTALHYALKGYPVIGYDIAPEKVKAIKAAALDMPGLDEWIQGSVKELTSSGLFQATDSLDHFWRSRPGIIFIAVPTEEKGTPSNSIVDTVITDVASRVGVNGYAPVVIIESTMTPGTATNIVIAAFERYGLKIGQDVFVGISPRRDWFGVGGRSVKTMERIYAGVSSACYENVHAALAIICEKLYKASSYQVAELTKCLENAFRFVELSLANQFSLAYPGINIIEVLELASTKWNMNHYVPSVRVGGHCIPVAGRYVVRGAEFPEALSIVQAALSGEEVVIHRLISYFQRKKIQKALVLGLSYHANMKISVFSAAQSLISLLRLNGIKYSVVDPLYTKQEIEAQSGAEAMMLLDDIGEFDAVVLAAGHAAFNQQEVIDWIRNSNIELIVDNASMWNNVHWDNKTYMRIGDGNMFEQVFNYGNVMMPIHDDSSQ